MMFVKACGVKEPKHVAWAAELGYSAVGVVLHPGSRRYCLPGTAVELARLARDKGVLSVAVGVTFNELELVHSEFDLVQVYEPVASQKHRLMLATACEPGFEEYRFLVYDQSRGSGKAKPFPVWLSKYRRRLVLAGGLDAENVGTAIQAVGPFGVDVSSGIEQEGEKDKRLMKEFMDAVMRAVRNHG